MRRVVVLLAALTAGAALLAAGAPARAADVRAVRLPMRDGVVLTALAVTPSAPHGRVPLVVMPSSWGLNDLEYLAPAQRLADRGYAVISYTARGWYDAGGTVGVAGPDDVRDVSDVIDWGLANAGGDPAHVGVAGVSYGAGIGLLAAGADPRVRAVAAMSGWTDLVDALYGNETRHEQGVRLLDGAARRVARRGADYEAALDRYFSFSDIDAVKAYGAIRGAQGSLAAINRNRPAILMANAFGDSLFEPNQLVRFFDGLTGPKRLELRPGDHATNELSGIFGRPNDVWDHVDAWLDHYLAGVDNGVDRRPPVQLRALGHGDEEYASWAATSTRRAVLRLGARTGPEGGRLTTGGGVGAFAWPLTGGVDTPADGPLPLLTNGLASIGAAPPPLILTWAVDLAHGAVWQGPAVAAPLRLRGIARLHLRLAASVPGPATVVAYLYDAGPLGLGRLLANVPFTARDLRPGEARAVDVDFPADAADVPAGHHVALVLDTVDPLYVDRTAAGTVVTLGATETDPATLTLPTR